MSFRHVFCRTNSTKRDDSSALKSERSSKKYAILTLADSLMVQHKSHHFVVVIFSLFTAIQLCLEPTTVLRKVFTVQPQTKIPYKRTYCFNRNRNTSQKVTRYCIRTASKELFRHIVWCGLHDIYFFLQ